MELSRFGFAEGVVVDVGEHMGETELFPLIEYCASDDTFHERCRIADVVL